MFANFYISIRRVVLGEGRSMQEEGLMIDLGWGPNVGPWRTPQFQNGKRNTLKYLQSDFFSILFSTTEFSWSREYFIIDTLNLLSEFKGNWYELLYEVLQCRKYTDAGHWSFTELILHSKKPNDFTAIYFGKHHDSLLALNMHHSLPACDPTSFHRTGPYWSID